MTQKKNKIGLNWLTHVVMPKNCRDWAAAAAAVVAVVAVVVVQFAFDGRQVDGTVSVLQ